MSSLREVCSSDFHEVIVSVDAKSERPALKSLKESFPEFRFVQSESRGVSHARNLGLQNARGDVFLLIDDDCIVESTAFLSEVIERSRNSSFVNGGGYRLKESVGYWGRVYQAVNVLWLRSGKSAKGQIHLLGGFIFGAMKLRPFVNFPGNMPWGGEEKAMLLALENSTEFSGCWHPDLNILHLDSSDTAALVRRAFYQGVAAGKHGLTSPMTRDFSGISFGLLPGLCVFFLISRLGVLLGRGEQALRRVTDLKSKALLTDKKTERSE